MGVVAQVGMLLQLGIMGMVRQLKQCVIPESSLDCMLVSVEVAGNKPLQGGLLLLECGRFVRCKVARFGVGF